MTVYDREQALRTRLNMFLNESFGLPDQDYYSQLDRKALARLKSLLSDINNIFTMRICIEFVQWLGKTLELDAATRVALKNSVLRSAPSNNGFDLDMQEPIGIVAEVKCNVPINGGQIYGSAQREGIVRDIKALMEGKKKSRANTSECLKFLVLLDTPEVRAATLHLVRNLRKYKDDVVFSEPGVRPYRKDRLYIVHVSDV